MGELLPVTPLVKTPPVIENEMLQSILNVINFQVSDCFVFQTDLL